MVYQNNEMGLIKCEGIARAIEMVGDVEVHDWISLSDRSKDFLVSMFEAYSNMELKVIYMCFGCGMTGKTAIEISFCCEDGVKVNLFFKKVYEHKLLVWRCWMRKCGYGIVRIFKQKFFPKLFRFIKELLNEVYMIHEEMFFFACRLEEGR